MNFLKGIYLAKAIAHTSGIANFLVLIDGRLAGGFIYARHRSGGDAIYLLSDFALAPKTMKLQIVSRQSTRMRSSIDGRARKPKSQQVGV